MLIVFRYHKDMIYLASGSPRRAELLRQIELDFEVLAVDIDESLQGAETAEDYVCRMAISKAQAGISKLSNKSAPAAVLGADTIITIDDNIIGKPVDPRQCRCILSRLSGRDHQVMSAVALALGDRVYHRISVSRVYFRSLSDDEIKHYCASDEPMDKAGAYAIQGRAAIFINRLEGSYSSVMGLPIYETAELLKEAGISV